jgi:hypothetical protein
MIHLPPPRFHTSQSDALVSRSMRRHPPPRRRGGGCLAIPHCRPYAFIPHASHECRSLATRFPLLIKHTPTTNSYSQ